MFCPRWAEIRIVNYVQVTDHLRFCFSVSLEKNGKTPLHYCVHEKGLLVTNLLLSRGASIDVEDVNGLTPLTLVVQQANLNVLQLFLNHHHLVATPQRHAFAGAVLLQAVECEVEDVVRFIVDNEYASVTVRNAKGETPMHRAILRCNPAMMELLLDLDRDGDNMTAATVLLETPAHYAARYGSNREVETLLQCLMSALGDLQELPELGAENPLNVEDARGRTSLYVAGTCTTFKDISQDATEGSHSMEVRDAKARLWLDHGALLFAPGVLAQELAGVSTHSRFNSPHLVLPVQVQRCLQMWLIDPRARDGDHGDNEEEDEDNLAENPDFPIEAFSELCMRWIANIDYSGSSLTLISIVTCAGYGYELLPLLVGLPLRRQGFSVWLRQLKKYATHDRGHILLLELYDELLSAWNEQEAV